MRSIKISGCIGDYVGGKEYEVYIDGDKRIWDEFALRYYINHHILNDIYRSHGYNNDNRYRISKFLTVLVLLGVEV